MENNEKKGNKAVLTLVYSGITVLVFSAISYISKEQSLGIIAGVAVAI